MDMVPGAEGDSSEPIPGDVSRLLQAWGAGDKRALDELTNMLYPELRRLARLRLAREHGQHSLQTTALVNETYLRLAACNHLQLRDRAHFFAISAQIMRRILVDYARRRNLKRGQGFHRISADNIDAHTIDAHTAERNGEIVAVDDALRSLEKLDSRKAQIIELRFFGGFTIEEAAQILDIAPITVMRDWESAKAWLFRELMCHADGT